MSISVTVASYLYYFSIAYSWRTSNDIVTTLGVGIVLLIPYVFIWLAGSYNLARSLE